MQEEDYTNDYGNLLPAEKLELIHQRALLKGVRRQDLDDLLQLAVMEVLAFKFEPAKANGATETTALIAVIDNCINFFWRKAARYRNRVKRFDEEEPGNVIEPNYDPAPQALLADTLEAAVAMLPAREREICELLGKGFKRHEVEARLNLTRWEYRHSEQIIRDLLRQKGFGRSEVEE